MSKKFYIWKDPACDGTNIEWLELTGREFFALLKRPEGKSRRFIRLGAGMDPDAEIIYIEATEEQYREWRQEQNASDYLFRYSRDTLTCSMDSPPLDTEVDSIHEVVPDEKVDVEKTALSHMAHEMLEKVLRDLSADETKLLAELYLQGKSAAEIARERGVNRSTVSRQVSALLKRLQKFF
jgi:RNA polymerase sigma factor (sigma-70 family)